jgi:hypothetical protein
MATLQLVRRMEAVTSRTWASEVKSQASSTASRVGAVEALHEGFWSGLPGWMLRRVMPRLPHQTVRASEQIANLKLRDCD